MGFVGLNPLGSQSACSDLLCCERDVAEDSAGIADGLASLAPIAVYFGVITMTPNQAASADRDPDRRPPVFYRSIAVDGFSIFYREAGRPEAPTLLLLHGFPSSSRMYEPLLTRLSGQFHLVAPDLTRLWPQRRARRERAAIPAASTSRTRDVRKFLSGRRPHVERAS